MDDAQAIRELIMKWAAAVHAGDIDGVLAATRTTS
jgi:ketosteroid isomerase-like protein